MTGTEYIIVGRDIGNAKYTEVDGEIYEKDDKPNGTPLDVGFIGSLMAEMSERKGAARQASKKEEELIKHCLWALEIDASQPEDVEREIDVGEIQVKVKFETRDTDNEVDPKKHTNTRILVVPADGTIQTALDELNNTPDQPFVPPLTYEPDEMMMAGHLASHVANAITDVSKPDDLDHLSWPLIKKHIASAVEANLRRQTAESGLSEREAYLRAVGIYATNMCR